MNRSLPPRRSIRPGMSWGTNHPFWKTGRLLAAVAGGQSFPGSPACRPCPCCQNQPFHSGWSVLPALVVRPWHVGVEQYAVVLRLGPHILGGIRFVPRPAASCARFQSASRSPASAPGRGRRIAYPCGPLPFCSQVLTEYSVRLFHIEFADALLIGVVDDHHFRASVTCSPCRQLSSSQRSK